MKSLIKVFEQKHLLALVFKSNIKVEGVKFFTGPENSLQFGIHRRKKNETVPAHFHQHSRPVKISQIQEVLYVRKGKIKVTVWNKKGKKIRAITLSENDCVLLLDCVHSLDFLAESQILEIKQGPYAGAETGPLSSGPEETTQSRR